MKKVDLNVDIGEGFPYDEALLQFATSANICCGEHAGSWELTQETVDLCLQRGRRYGMHPGYPDRENMGRKSPLPSQMQETIDSIHSQIWRFYGHLKGSYIKPHGAYYNDTAVILPREWTAESKPMAAGSSYKPGSEFLASLPAGALLCDMISTTGALLGLPGTSHEVFAEFAPGDFIREGFADRAYRSDGTLVPRSEPGAVLQDPGEIKAQVLELAPRVDSICLHGDTTDCLEFAELIYKTLVDKGYEVGY